MEEIEYKEDTEGHTRGILLTNHCDWPLLSRSRKKQVPRDMFAKWKKKSTEISAGGKVLGICSSSRIDWSWRRRRSSPKRDHQLTYNQIFEKKRSFFKFFNFYNLKCNEKVQTTNKQVKSSQVKSDLLSCNQLSLVIKKKVEKCGASSNTFFFSLSQPQHRYWVNQPAQ